MTQFKAIRIDKDPYRAAYADFDETELMDGDVTVRVTHSTVNYKDGLAITGKSPVVRRFPMIPGIDFAGVVESSSHADFKPGDEVVLNGWGVGETHFGGYSQKARVKGDWLVPLPKGIYRGAEHGDRHRRLYRDARRHGAGEAGHDARPRPGAGDRRGGRRRLDRHLPCSRRRAGA